MTEGPTRTRGRRVSFTERRERRAAIDDPAVVHDAALRFLESRSRSVAEVRRRLSTAGYRKELVDGAISRLIGLALLDDTAFASAWVASRDRAHPRGENALRRELQLKGIERQVIDGVLEDRRADLPVEAATSGGSADAAAAVRLLERKGRALSRIADPRVRRQRAYTLLARHGFDPGVSGDAASAWAGSLTDDPEGDPPVV
ncbi:MAG: regulatory protein RecX [Chloroflexota bacterium]